MEDRSHFKISTENGVDTWISDCGVFNLEYTVK